MVEVVRKSRINQMSAKLVLKEIENVADAESLPIIGPKKGELLGQIIKKHKPKVIVEVGTLVGYSAILMSQYLFKGGKIITIEVDPYFAKIAQRNLQKAGVEDLVEIKVGDAKRILPKLDIKIDMLFLDGIKDEYIDYLKVSEDKLSKNALVVSDNVKVFEDVMEDFLSYLRKGTKYKSKTFDFGFDGVEVSHKIS